MIMESPDYSPVPHHSDASRPSLGFPLGTALLLIIIFSLSGIFSCCYHWDKFRSLRQSFSDDLDLESGGGRTTNDGDPSKPKPLPLAEKKEEKESVPVIMPGDHIPTFIAMPCPCQPLRPEKFASSPPHQQNPLKPPRFPAPLY